MSAPDEYNKNYCDEVQQKLGNAVSSSINTMDVMMKKQSELTDQSIKHLESAAKNICNALDDGKRRFNENDQDHDAIRKEMYKANKETNKEVNAIKNKMFFYMGALSVLGPAAVLIAQWILKKVLG